MVLREHNHNLMFGHCHSEYSAQKEAMFNSAVDIAPAGDANSVYDHIKANMDRVGGFSLLHVVGWGNGWRGYGGGPAVLWRNKDGHHSAAILF